MIDTKDTARQVADAIGDGLLYLPEAADMAQFLRRLDTGRRLWLAGALIWSLPPDTAEELAEATLADLRTGDPIPPFDDLRAEARDWATFASRGELKAYLGAIWGRLPEAERQSFRSAVRPKQRAA